MRDILFRGKRIDNDEWVYGSFCMDAVEQKNGLCGVDGFIRLYDFDKGKMQMHEVDRETIGQFTGLTDKNGKKIFEGDILEYTSYTGTGIKEVKRAVVFWDEHRWSYKVIYNNRWTAQWNNNGYTCDVYKEVVAKYGEVIGNIHDNPELLENP